MWHQGKTGVPGRNELGDQFGFGLLSGDFDGDGFADLAIGIPDEDAGTVPDAGTVVVLRGSTSGLTAAGAVKLRQGSNGLPSQPAPHEFFGSNLAVGDVNGDARDDLVVVVASDTDFRDLAADEEGSGVHVIFGGPAGPAPSGSQFFGPEAFGFDRYSHMGMDPTLADFNQDGRDDLASLWWQESAGENRLVVLHGHPDGLHPAVLAVTDTPGVDGFWSWASWRRGARLAAADVNGDGLVDLAVYDHADFGHPGNCVRPGDVLRTAVGGRSRVRTLRRFLPEMIKAVLERGMGAELTEHLGYERGDPAGRGSGNSRNGTTGKTVATEVGDLRLDQPRDRNGSFGSALVPKGARRLGGWRT